MLWLLLSCVMQGDTDESHTDKADEKGCLMPEDDTLELEGQVGTPVTATLTLDNPCAGDLEILDLDLDPASASLALQLDTALVPAGQQAQLTATWDASDVESYSGVLTLTLDGEESTVEIPVEAQTDGPRLGATWTTLEATLGCSTSGSLTLENTGTEDLELELTEVDDGEWSIDGADLTLKPGASELVEVTWTPAVVGAATLELPLATNDTTNPSVTLSATADTDDWVEESSTWAAPTLDLLFVLDDLTSATLLNDAEGAFDDLFITLSSGAPDHRVSAVYAADACAADPPLWTSADASDPQDELGELWDLWDTYGQNPWHDQGLTAARRFLAETDGGCNDGFLRDGTLAVVVVTDNVEDSDTGWEQNVELLRAWVPHDDQLVVSAFAGEAPYGCGSTDYARRLEAAADATGGVYLEACIGSDYAQHMEDLVEASAPDPLLVRLEGEPDPSTPSATVDGEEVSITWDAERNGIVLAEAVEEGALVTVTYLPADVCP